MQENGFDSGTGARHGSSSRKAPSAARFGCEHLVAAQGAPVPYARRSRG
ncbi:hypothetical protein A2U01_0072601, partial [Trifolium medium]|nr:hypothetical protein [Trifolium medium]